MLGSIANLQIQNLERGLEEFLERLDQMTDEEVREITTKTLARAMLEALRRGPIDTGSLR